VDYNGYSVKVDANGTVGYASGHADVKFDPLNGSVIVDAGAIAAVAKGEVSGSVDAGLVKAGVKASGYAGAVGVEAKVGYEDGEVKIKIGAALGLGGSVEISIGIGNWAEKASEKVNAVVSNVLSAIFG
jgi:hypothetical protein